MEALGVRKNQKSAWPRSGGDSKGSSLLLEQPNNKQRSSGMDSPLATQLQQAWLQTQLPKRNIPKLDFLSPLPSPDYQRSSPEYYQYSTQPQARTASVPSSFSQPSQPSPPARISSSLPLHHPSSDTFSEAYTGHSDVGSYGESEVGADSDPMEEDYMLAYLSDMLMDEDLSKEKCMYVQCSAYQAMNKELADLISEPAPADNSYYASAAGGGAAPVGYYSEEHKDPEVNSWIDEILNSNPHDSSLQEGQHQPIRNSSQVVDLDDAVTSIASGITSIKTGESPGSAPAGAGPGGGAQKSHLNMDCSYIESDALDGVDYSNGRSKVDYSNGRSGVESLVELYPLLMQCAQAVAADDVRGAHQLINQLRQKSSPFGDGGQRMTHYFLDALVARLSGTGAKLYLALKSPTAHDMILAYKLFVQCNPLPKIAHFVANATIENAVKDSDRVHIIDYGILYGVQWPCLLHKLSQRPGGPPHVRITGIDFAESGFKENERVEETGRRLTEKAQEFGLDFEYHAIAGKWENIQPAQLNLREDETLIVNSMFRLRNLLDETVMASSPRKMVLAKIRSLNPKLFFMGIFSAGMNSPFFMSRFRETVNHFSALFDLVQTTIPPETGLREMAEREVFGRAILNIVACEGPERIERAEAYPQWQSRSINAGFKQEPLHVDIVAKAQKFLERFHNNYGLAQDGKWLLGGWRERVLHGLAAWVPA